MPDSRERRPPAGRRKGGRGPASVKAKKGEAESPSPKSRSGRRGLPTYAVLAGSLGLVAIAVVWVAWSAWRGGSPAGTPGASLPPTATTSRFVTRDPREPLSIASIQRGPHLVFQNVIRNEDYAEVSLVPLDSPAGMRVSTDLICERVHYAAGHGICLAAEHETQSRYFAILFGADFVPISRVPLDGAPTFARVAPDGSLAAASVQTTPPTELEPFAPSQTLLIDTSSGDVLADLADFSVTRDGVALTDAEMDFWGVTFKADSDGFFASLRVSGNVHLVEGSVRERRMAVLQLGISAPSLSPDGTRVAFAKLISNIGPTWRFHVMDLQTMVDNELAETKSIDDQMEWIDDQRLLYGLGADIWSVTSDGDGQPIPFLFGGLSPAVVRPF